jgi:hypothetical protein
MNMKLFAALPVVAVLSVAPAMAGSLGGSVTDPEVSGPVIVAPPPAGFGGIGGLGTGAVVGGLAAAALLAVVLSDSSTTTTTTGN